MLLFVAGCGTSTDKGSDVTEDTVAEDIVGDSISVVEETLDVESVGDDFSVDSTEDDWGDII